MRENIGIYRGKRIDTGEWKEGYLHGVQDRSTGKRFVFIVDENNESHKVNPETIGEHTGLTDKNGVKIFEGDILSSDEYPYFSDGNQNYFAEIVWFDNSPAFGLYTFKSPNSVVRGVAEGVEFIEDDLSDMEVIGNIYDNPELIGGNKL